jgi:hypothetical protein
MAVVSTHRYVMPADVGGYYVDPDTNTIVAGDLVQYDTSSFYVKRHVTPGSSGPNFIGVAEGDSPISPQIDATAGKYKRLRVRHCGVFRFKVTASEEYKHGDNVVMGADSQTVKLQGGAAATEVIGQIWAPLLTAAHSASAGDELDVYIRANLVGVHGH